MYNIKNFFNKNDFDEHDRLKKKLYYINSNKRLILYSYSIDNIINCDKLKIEENKYIVDKKKFDNKIKLKIHNNIFNNNIQKYKYDFINSYNNYLNDDVLEIIFYYYYENSSILAFKYCNKSSYFLSSNLNLIKKIFLNNDIDKIYKINSDILNNKININFFDLFSKKIYDRESYNFSKINMIKYDVNDFYAPIISIKLFYYNKSIKNIKHKNINIINYNNIHIIDSFLKNKKLTKFEFYYINSIYNPKQKLITSNEIFKYNFLNRIHDYLLQYFK